MYNKGGKLNVPQFYLLEFSIYFVPLKETLVSILSRLWFHHWFVLFNLWLKNIQTTHGMKKKKKKKGMNEFLIIFDIVKTQIMQSPVDLSSEDHIRRMVVHNVPVW